MENTTQGRPSNLPRERTQHGKATAVGAKIGICKPACVAKKTTTTTQNTPQADRQTQQLRAQGKTGNTTAQSIGKGTNVPTLHPGENSIVE
jgi:hypothetical protein